MKLKTILSLFFLTCTSLVYAQGEFSKKIIDNAFVNLNYNVSENVNGGFFLDILTFERISYCHITENGMLKWAIQYDVNNFDDSIEILPKKNGGMFGLLTDEDMSNSGNLILVSINENGEKDWDIKLSSALSNNFSGSHMQSTFDSSLVVVFHDNQFNGNSIKVNENGGIHFAKKYNSNVPHFISSICSASNGGFIISGILSNSNTDSFIVRIDSEGIPVWAKSYGLGAYSNIYPFSDGTFLLLYDINSTLEGGLALARVNDMGEFIWNIMLDDSYGSINKALINGDDEVILPGIYNSSKIHLLKFDIEGDFLEGIDYGSSLVIADMIQSSDDGLLFSKTIDLDGQVAVNLLNLKDNGFSSICEGQPICSIQYDFTDLPLSSIIDFSAVDVVDIDTTYEAQLLNIDVTIEDYCQPQNIITSEFEFPDTICKNNSAAISGLNQLSADTWQWYFEGGLPAFSSAQSPGSVDYENSGIFEVRQIIEKLGCLDTFSRQVVVLPELILNLPDDTLFCHDDIYGIDLNNNSSDTNFNWSDIGVSDSFREFEAEGVYSVRASNSYCFTEDSLMVSFFESVIPIGQNVFSFDDTVLCDYDNLEVNLFFENIDEYIWNDGYTEGSRVLNETGFYSVAISKEQCSISDTINLIFEECLPDIYVPNAFSPNGDGINEEFRIFGKDISVQKIDIYDRWGGLIFESKNFDDSWDGKVGNRLMLSGVYIYLIEYLDENNNQVRFLSGEVYLIQ